MNQSDLHVELLSRDANIALAELEAAKSNERVKELAYMKAKYMYELQIEINKANEAHFKASQSETSTKE